MWKRVLISLVALGGLTAYFATPTSNASPPSSSAEPRARVVRVAPVTASETSRERRFSGVTQASDRAQLAFTLSGRLASRPVELGDHVREGDLLAQLDRGPLVHRVQAARASTSRADAQLVQSRRTQTRVRSLADSKALSEASRDEADSTVEVLDAGRSAASVELREAQRLLAEATLRAPFDGVVSEVRSEPEEYVLTGSPVVVLSGEGAVEVEVEVPESLITALSPGQAVRVEIPALDGRVVDASITAVGHAAPARGRLFPVVVRLSTSEGSDGIIPGMAAELILELGQGEGVSVPVEAVINPGGMHPSVFQIRDGQVHEVPVEVLRVSKGRAVITGELVIADEVVVLGHAGISEGETVEVLR